LKCDKDITKTQKRLKSEIPIPTTRLSALTLAHQEGKNGLIQRNIPVHAYCTTVKAHPLICLVI
jgi:hypothetical protein